MNIPGSYSSENHKRNDLSNHDSFFLENNGEKIKIYPELVETAEHLVLGLENNPEFKEKITNTEYDMLIGDDVSGRTVTLLVKHIIDHFRKVKGLQGGIKNIFIDKPNNIPSPIIKNITKKNILVTTEYISRGYTLDSIIDTLDIRKNIFDIFSQRTSSTYNNYFNVLNKRNGNGNFQKTELHHNLARYIYKVFSGDIQNIIIGQPKICKQNNNLIGLHSKDTEGNTEESMGFSRKLTEKEGYNQKIVNNVRLQIKILAKYIIINYLS